MPTALEELERLRTEQGDEPVSVSPAMGALQQLRDEQEPPAPREAPDDAGKRAREAQQFAVDQGVSLDMANDLNAPPSAEDELPSFLTQLVQAPYHAARRIAGGTLETGQLVERGLAHTVADIPAMLMESPKARLVRVGSIGPNLLEQAGILSPEIAGWMREKALPLLAGSVSRLVPTPGAQTDVASGLLRLVGKTREADVLDKVQAMAAKKVRVKANVITEGYVKYLLAGGAVDLSIEQTKPYLSETPAESVKAVFTNPQLLAERVGGMIPYMVGTVALAIATKGAAAPFIMTYLVEGEGARQDMPEDASPAEKADISQIVGFINGAIEMWQVSKILEFVGGKAAQRAFAKKATAAAVKNLAASEAAKSAWAKGASVGIQAIRLGAIEGGQEVIQQANQELASSGITGEPLDPGLWERMLEAGGVAAVASVLTGGLFRAGQTTLGVKARGVEPGAPPAEISRAETPPQPVEGVRPTEARGAEVVTPEPGAPAEAPAEPGLLPEGAEPKPPETTSIKQAVMEAEREEREAQPLPEPTPQTRQQWVDEAKQRVEADPELPQRLVQKLREQPLALNPVEVAVLQNHRRTLKNAYQEATENLFAASETGDAAAKTEAQATVDTYNDRLDALDVATQVAGTAWGRAGVARQIELAQDYSLAGMVRRRQAAKGGTALTDAELAKIKTEQERLVALEAELAAREKVVAAREEAAKTVRAKGRIRKVSLAGPKTTTIRPAVRAFGATNRVFTRERHDAALASLRSKAGRLNVGVDVAAMADLVKVGGFYFEGGMRKFEAWASQMAESLGDLAAQARPHFAEIWKRIHAERLADVQENIAAKYNRAQEAGVEPRGLTTDIQELFQVYTARDMSRDDAVAAVHEFMQTLDPDITLRETMDAISGYGKWRLLDKDELKAEVRRRKGELQELAKLEDMAEGRAPARTGFERQDPSDARRDLIKKVNDAKRQGGYSLPDPETQLKSSVQSLRTRWENEITDLTAKIKAGDFAKPERRGPVALDDEMQALKFERDRIKKEFNEGNFRLRMKQRTILQKLVGIGQEALNLPRAIKSSLDLSALLRQNLITTISHPIRSLKKTVPAAFRGLTPKGEHAIDLEITSRENFPNYVRDKLSLTEHGQSLAKMEEAFMSRYAEKVPLVAASQRAYTTTLNVSRADSYDVLAATLSRWEGAPITPAEGKVIANYTNVATGRGGGGKYGSALTGLNSVFFAPRNLISRFEFLFGQPLWHGILSGKVPLRGTVKVRLLIAGEYARFLTGMAAVYALAVAAGFRVEYDPRKSTFGKIRVGKTWLDPLAGLSQITVFLSRLVTGEKVTTKGREIALRGEDKVYGSGDMGDVIWDFVRSKFSPVVGAGVTIAGGETYIGEPVTPASTAADLFMPMAPQDMYEAMIANGVPEGTALSILAFWGASLQTYGEEETGRETRGRESRTRAGSRTRSRSR